MKVGPRPGRLAVGEGGVWVLNRGDGSVTRIDPKTARWSATIAVDPAVAEGEIAAGEGSVWISAPGVPLLRIDPRTNRAVQRFDGDGGGAVVTGHGSVWVSGGTESPVAPRSAARRQHAALNGYCVATTGTSPSSAHEERELGQRRCPEPAR